MCIYIYIHGHWISLVHLVDSHGIDCWRDSSTLSPDFLTPVTRRDSTKFQDPVISKLTSPKKKDALDVAHHHFQKEST